MLDPTVDKQTKNEDNVPIPSFSEINSNGHNKPSEKTNNQDIEEHLESAPDPKNSPHDSLLVAPSSLTVTEPALITLEYQGPAVHLERMFLLGRGQIRISCVGVMQVIVIKVESMKSSGNFRWESC